MKKIVIDARMMGLEHAGIGRYIANLVREIKNLKFKSPRSGISAKYKNYEITFIQPKIEHYSLKEQLLMPLIIAQSGADLVHFPHFNVPLFCPRPFVVTIHDLIKHQSRGPATTTRWPLIYWLKYGAYCLIFRSAVRRARLIIVPSQAVKKELLTHYRLAPEKVVVTHEAAAEVFKPKKTAKREPFIVYTGSLYPHKNIERLIQAVRLIKVPLKIVCSRSVFTKRLAQKTNSRLVEFLGFVSDRELVRLYQQATALVQPSLMEGFDLNVIEAMASGLPVVISDIPVHREIAGQAAVYFNPDDIQNMAAAIKRVLNSPQLRQSLLQKGLQQAKKYQWSKTAQQTLKVYETCLL